MWLTICGRILLGLVHHRMKWTSPENIIRVQRQIIHPMSMSGHRPAQNSILSSPHLNRSILGRSEQNSCATPSNSRHCSSMTWQDLYTLPQNHIPNPNISVNTSTGQLTTFRILMIRFPAQTVHPFLVSHKWFSHLFSRFRIPNPNLTILTGTCHTSTIRRPSNAQHPLFVSGTSEVWRFCVKVPQSKGRVSGTTCQMLSVWTEIQRDHCFRVSGHGTRASSDWTHFENSLWLVDDIYYGFCVNGTKIDGLVQGEFDFIVVDEKQKWSWFILKIN